MMINAVDEAMATVVHNVLMIMTKMMIIAIRSMFLTIPMSNCNINVFYHKKFFSVINSQFECTQHQSWTICRGDIFDIMHHVTELIIKEEIYTCRCLN